jgi:hypothetical protein
MKKNIGREQVCNGGKGAKLVECGDGLGVLNLVAKSFCGLGKCGCSFGEEGSTKFGGAKGLSKKARAAFNF